MAAATNAGMDGGESGSVIMGEGSDMGDVDDGNPESEGEGDGSTAGVLHVHAHHHHHHGHTPAIPTPPLASVAGSGVGAHWSHPHHVHPPPHYYLASGSNHAPSSSHLSQSAPASITPAFLWGGPPLTPNYATHGRTDAAGPGGAQHVTGTMGAMVLDEVDEGDETFGEEGEGESEIMVD